MNTPRWISICVLALAMSACNAPPGVDDPGEPQAGRAETQSIRSTEKIGYSGDAIGDKIDGVLDANDQRGAQLDAQLDGQTSTE